MTTPTEPLPPLPPGYGYDEHNRPVPTVEPPSFSREEKERANVILEVMKWALGSRAKTAAVECVATLDTRAVGEVAKSYRLSASVVHRQIKALKKFIGDLP